MLHEKVRSRLLGTHIAFLTVGKCDGYFKRSIASRVALAVTFGPIMVSEATTE